MKHELLRFVLEVDFATFHLSVPKFNSCVDVLDFDCKNTDFPDFFSKARNRTGERKHLHVYTTCIRRIWVWVSMLVYVCGRVPAYVRVCTTCVGLFLRGCVYACMCACWRTCMFVIVYVCVHACVLV